MESQKSYNSTTMTFSVSYIPKSKNPIDDIRISSVGIWWAPSLEIQWNLLVGFDQPLKLALDTNSLKLVISSRDRS
jgi:hypothetical protein